MIKKEKDYVEDEIWNPEACVHFDMLYVLLILNVTVSIGITF